MTAETTRRLVGALIAAALLLADAPAAHAQSAAPPLVDATSPTAPTVGTSDLIVSRAKRRDVAPRSNGTGQTGGLPAKQTPGAPGGPGAPSIPPAGATGGPPPAGGGASGAPSADASRDVRPPVVVVSRPLRSGEAWLVIGRVLDARTGRPLAGEVVAFPFGHGVLPERSDRRGFVVWRIVPTR